jgi:hypothetical protein
VKGIFERSSISRRGRARLRQTQRATSGDVFFTFSLSPILDDEGTVLGVLDTYVETTSRVLAERRMATLQGLAERAVRARTASEACAEALAALSANPYDLGALVSHHALRELGYRSATSGRPRRWALELHHFE